MLKVGMESSVEKIIKSNETAKELGSGGLNVLATPILVALMENASYTMVQKELENGETTVGISLNIKHLKANNVGEKIKCTSVLEGIDGRKLVFNVKVFYNDTLVGEGTHERFIVNEAKFMEKIKR